MGMSGKWSGIRIGNSPTSRAAKKRCQPPFCGAQRPNLKWLTLDLEAGILGGKVMYE
jgi:hypothetical protein